MTNLCSPAGSKNVFMHAGPANVPLPLNPFLASCPDRVSQAAQGTLEEKGSLPQFNAVQSVATPSVDGNILGIVGKALPPQLRPFKNVYAKAMALTQESGDWQTETKKHSPAKFFKHYEIDPELIDSTDIEAIYSLLSDYPLGSPIPLLPFFGLKAHQLLQNLPFSEGTKAMMKDWQVIYLKLCMAMQKTSCSTSLQRREGVPIIVDALKKSLETYKNAIEEIEELKNHSIKRLHGYHSEKTKPLLEQLIEHHTLLIKLLNHSSSETFFWQQNVRAIPGFVQVLPFETTQQMTHAGKLLKTYTAFIDQGLNWIQKDCLGCNIKEVFQALSKKIGAIDFANDSEDSMSKIRENTWTLLQWLSNEICELEEVLDEHLEKPIRGIIPQAPIKALSGKYVHIAASLNLAWQIFDTLNSSILAIADPTFKFARNLERRLYKNLFVLGCHMENVSKKEMDRAEQKMAGVETLSESSTVQGICENFVAQMFPLSCEMKKIRECMAALGQETHIPLLFISNDLKELMKKFKTLTNKVIKELGEYGKQHPDKLRNLVQETAVVAQALIAQNDALTLLHGTGPWPCILPDEYLAFLALEKRKSPTALPEIVPSLVEEKPLPQEAERTEITVHLPLPETAPLPPTMAATKPVKQSAKPVEVSPQVVPRAIKGKEKKVAVDITKQRLLLDVMRELGCDTEEGGEHIRILLHGALVTTVPRHKEIKKGTAQSALKKVTSALYRS